jgi:hypothetical protein
MSHLRIVCRRIKQGPPQTRECDAKLARNKYPPGRTVPVGLVHTEAGRELESAENAVDQGADNMHHHRHGCREEPCVIWRDLRTAPESNHVESAGNNRDEAERNHPSGYEPFGFGGEVN